MSRSEAEGRCCPASFGLLHGRTFRSTGAPQGAADSSEPLAANQAHWIRHASAARTGCAGFFFNLVAFAFTGRKKQVLFQAVLARVEIVIAPLQRQQFSVPAALHDLS